MTKVDELGWGSEVKETASKSFPRVVNSELALNWKNCVQRKGNRVH